MADFPASADGVEHRGIDPHAYEPDIDDLRRRIESVDPYFCDNPGCIQAFCPHHGRCLSCSQRLVDYIHNSAQEFPPLPPAVARVASNDYPEGVSCGDMCFREIDEAFQVKFVWSLISVLLTDYQEDSVQWGDPEIEELLCILEIIPDTVPCGLAKLVRKPCREVLMLPQLAHPILNGSPTGIHSAPTPHSRR